MHDLLFGEQLQLAEADLRGYAARLHLDIGRYISETATHMFLPKIRADMQSASESGARGTPTFFVNDKIQDVSFGMRSLFDAVEAALQLKAGDEAPG
jgi:protein-disulfide isomerase